MMIHRISQALIASLLASLFVVLTACGPGTGGTGTGPSISDIPTPGIVPSSYVGNANTCTTPCSTGAISIVSVTASTVPVTLTLTGDHINVHVPCASITFDATWQLSNSRDVFVLGTYESPSADRSILTKQIGTMALTFASSSAEAVEIILKDSAGAVLLGPLTLQRSNNTLSSSAPSNGCQ